MLPIVQKAFFKQALIPAIIYAISLPVLPQSHSCVLSEDFTKVTLGGESQVSGNFNIRVRGIGQKVFGQLYFFLQDKICEGDFFLGFK